MNHDLESLTDSQKILAPLLEGKPVVLHDRRANDLVFLTPLSVYKIWNSDMHILVGTTKGRMRLVDVSKIKINDLHFAGLRMSSAKVLKEGLEKTFHVSIEGKQNGNQTDKKTRKRSRRRAAKKTRCKQGNRQTKSKKRKS